MAGSSRKNSRPPRHLSPHGLLRVPAGRNVSSGTENNAARSRHASAKHLGGAMPGTGTFAASERVIHRWCAPCGTPSARPAIWYPDKMGPARRGPPGGSRERAPTPASCSGGRSGGGIGRCLARNVARCSAGWSTAPAQLPRREDRHLARLSTPPVHVRGAAGLGGGA